MEKIITEQLKKKYPELSTAIMSWLIERLKREAKTEEEVTKQVEELSVQKITEGYADMRATQATKTAVENYEKKHGLKDGKKQETEGGEDKNPINPNSKPDDDTPEWAKQLIKQNTELREEMNALKEGKVRETRTEVITELVKNLPEGLRKGYLLTDYAKLTEDEFESVKGEIKSGVDEYEKNIQSNGARLQEPPLFGGANDKKELPPTDDADNFLRQMGIKKTDKN